jgi:beta-lactamase superfamily II metal-dependent hydrolase
MKQAKSSCNIVEILETNLGLCVACPRIREGLLNCAGGAIAASCSGNQHREDAVARKSKRVGGLAALIIVVALALSGWLGQPEPAGTDVTASANTNASASSASNAEAASGEIVAHFIDVGQGDSEFVELPDGKCLLIDGGVPDAGATVVSYIQSLGYTKIDYLVASHPHEDHIGGLLDVLDTFEIGEVWAPDVSANTQTYEDFLDKVEASGASTHEAKAGETIASGDDYTVEVLGPVPDSTAGSDWEDSDSDYINNRSAIIRITFGDKTFLFTGDACTDRIAEACSQHVDVLKAGHHGSKTSTNAWLLKKITPNIAVLSYGLDNDYGYPKQKVLDALSDFGVETYGTGANGTVTIACDGSTFSVSCEKSAAVTAP